MRDDFFTLVRVSNNQPMFPTTHQSHNMAFIYSVISLLFQLLGSPMTYSDEKLTMLNKSITFLVMVKDIDVTNIKQ